MDEIVCDDPKVSVAYAGSLHARSHGESFFALCTHRLVPRGLHLFDEPESALSPQRQLALLALLHELARGGAQLVIATHSPILLADPDAWIYLLDVGGPRRFAYEETEHGRVTREFLLRRERVLRELLQPEPPRSTLT